MMNKTIIIIIIFVGVIIYRLYGLFTNSQEKKWINWAREIGMNYIPIEKKNFFKKIKEYEVDNNNPRIRKRKDKIMEGLVKGEKIRGYFLYEIERRGTKERLQATKFELEFFDNKNNYPELTIQKKNFLEHLFVKIPETTKVELPPQISEIFEAKSTRPKKATKIINQITSLLTKDAKDIKIIMNKYKISITIKRTKVSSEKLFTMRKIMRKLLETDNKQAKIV